MALMKNLKVLPQYWRNNTLETEKEGGQEDADYALPFFTPGGTVVPKQRKAVLQQVPTYHASSPEYGYSLNMR